MKWTWSPLLHCKYLFTSLNSAASVATFPPVLCVFADLPGGSCSPSGRWHTGVGPGERHRVRRGHLLTWWPVPRLWLAGECHAGPLGVRGRVQECLEERAPSRGHTAAAHRPRGATCPLAAGPAVACLLVPPRSQHRPLGASRGHVTGLLACGAALSARSSQPTLKVALVLL